MTNIDHKTITKSEMETIVTDINNNKQKTWTKHDKKLILRKLVQYTKKVVTPKAHPTQRSKLDKPNPKRNISKRNPENLLTQEDFANIIKTTTNKH
jgi:hypothetical protein